MQPIIANVEKAENLQSGPLPVMNGVITPINGIINGYLGL